MTLRRFPHLRPLLLILPGAIASWLNPSAARAADLADWVPPDAQLAVQCASVSALDQAMAASPLLLLGGGGKGGGFESLLGLAGGKSDERSRTLLQGFKSFFPGQAVIYFNRPRFDEKHMKHGLASLGDALGGDFGLIAQCNGDPQRAGEWVERALLNAPADATRRDQTVGGARVRTVTYTVRRSAAIPDSSKKRKSSGSDSKDKSAALPLVQEVPVSFQYAFLGDCLLFTRGAAGSLQTLLAAAQGAGQGAATSSPRRRAVFASLPADCSVRIYLDGALSLPQLDSFLPRFSGVDWDGLHLESLNAAALGLRLSGGRVEAHLGVYSPSASRQGLARCLFAIEPTQNRTAGLVPADALAYGSLGIRWKEAWGGFLETFTQVAPLYKALFDQQVAAIEAQAGVNLETDVIGSLGPEIAAYARPGGPATILIEARQGARLEQALSRAINCVSPILQFRLGAAEYRGVRVWKPMASANTVDVDLPPFAFALSPAGFLVASSDSQAVAAALDRLSSGAASLAQNERFRAAAAALPPERCGVFYGPLVYGALTRTQDLWRAALCQ